MGPKDASAVLRSCVTRSIWRNHSAIVEHEQAGGITEMLELGCGGDRHSCVRGIDLGTQDTGGEKVHVGRRIRRLGEAKELV